MSNIYFLQVMCNLDEEEHYENVYSSKDKAIEEGKAWLDKLLRKQYEDWFEEDKSTEILDLTHEQLFQLKAMYDFSITEFNPEYIDKINYIEKLPEIKEWDIHDVFISDLTPSKIKYSYDYNGIIKYISGIYLFNYKNKKKEYEVTMQYEDYINPKAGTKFKKGDIVKIKNCKKNHDNYPFANMLHVITDTPHKKENQKFFKNTYDVIVNHNCYDEGCHVDVFEENELELYTEKISDDSPLMFLSKYFRGEIELNNIEWMDIECGRITLNENKSFRDIPEIIEQLKGEQK